MSFPPTFNNAWDITFPPDTQLANLLGQDLRNLRNDIMQRMSLLSGTLANRPTPETVNATWGGAGFGLVYFASDTGQIFQWNGAAWVSVTFAQALTAVAVDRLGLTLNVPVTFMVNTGASNAFYRLSAFAEVTTAVATNSTLPSVGIGFTDADTGVGSTLVVSPTSSLNFTAAASSGVVGFYAKANTPINYLTQGYISNPPGMVYSIHLRLEGPF